MSGARRAAVWLAAAATVIGTARQIAYALPGSSVADRLSASAGGIALPELSAIVLGAALAASVAGTWLVVLGVRERSELSLAGWTAPPPLRARTVAVRAAGLSAATIVAFTALESVIHVHEGLGFHGWHCIAGPVHRNAAPILVALSLLAAAAITAAEHVAAAACRMILRRAERSRHGPGHPPAAAPPASRPAPRARRSGAARTRGPPIPARP